MKSSHLLLSAAFALALLTPYNADAQINSNRALMERLDRMEKDMGMMQRQISRGSDRPSYIAPTDADAKSITTGNFDTDLLQKVFTLEEEMRKLRGEIETNQYEMERLKNQLKLMEEDTDIRLRAIESGGAQNTGSGADQQSNQQSSTNMIPPPAQQTGSNTNLLEADKNAAFRPDDGYSPPDSSGKLAKPGTFSADAPRQHYNQAFRLLNQNRYEDAEKSFAEFTNKYPEHSLIGNAYYWLGETHFIRDNFLEAADNFRAGYQKLPNGPKAPDNLLKLAITLKELDRTEDACTVLEQIDKKFKDASTNLLQRAASEKKLMGC